jgi:hypothetical protein
MIIFYVLCAYVERTGDESLGWRCGLVSHVQSQQTQYDNEEELWGKSEYLLPRRRTVAVLIGTGRGESTRHAQPYQNSAVATFQWKLGVAQSSESLGYLPRNKGCNLSSLITSNELP